MKIGELSKLTNCPIETIRYYEREGMLSQPSRTESNYRMYEQTHVEQLSFIRYCRSLDMTLDEIRVLLKFRNNPQSNCDEVNILLDEHIDHVANRIKELKALENYLKELRKCCHETQSIAQCGILKKMKKETNTAVKTNPKTSNPIKSTHSKSVN